MTKPSTCIISCTKRQPHCVLENQNKLTNKLTSTTTRHPHTTHHHHHRSVVQGPRAPMLALWEQLHRRTMVLEAVILLRLSKLVTQVLDAQLEHNGDAVQHVVDCVGQCSDNVVDGEDSNEGAATDLGADALTQVSPQHLRTRRTLPPTHPQQQEQEQQQQRPHNHQQHAHQQREDQQQEQREQQEQHGDHVLQVTLTAGREQKEDVKEEEAGETDTETWWETEAEEDGQHRQEATQCHDTPPLSSNGTVNGGGSGRRIHQAPSKDGPTVRREDSEQCTSQVPPHLSVLQPAQGYTHPGVTTPLQIKWTSTCATPTTVTIELYQLISSESHEDTTLELSSVVDVGASLHLDWDVTPWERDGVQSVAVALWHVKDHVATKCLDVLGHAQLHGTHEAPLPLQISPSIYYTVTVTASSFDAARQQQTQQQRRQQQHHQQHHQQHRVASEFFEIRAPQEEVQPVDVAASSLLEPGAAVRVCLTTTHSALLDASTFADESTDVRERSHNHDVVAQSSAGGHGDGRDGDDEQTHAKGVGSDDGEDSRAALSGAECQTGLMWGTPSGLCHDKVVGGASTCDDGAVQQTAGSIKCVFDSEEVDCRGMRGVVANVRDDSVLVHFAAFSSWVPRSDLLLILHASPEKNSDTTTDSNSDTNSNSHTNSNSNKDSDHSSQLEAGGNVNNTA
ncbi:hypothetical protein PTSG_11798 [Salpingoeca rosetta]|uniref:Uncharacterized protein n=1 Tax=Salpingoeca rosetta (strain ATCC 50818 / BSB-021) TaxID=946362 RepID=F2TZA1_SALR5|nr:uncharacterized protein PTSG_11798 [Salpingoeca rosetta]EGD78925.1 hypothetical protein PTSG_11798 [Salpingoeca rosetta]|eukprot:XP_004997881.1 hypothetical protein PTSG_11798 [Salpingoeca rosetta]